MKFDTKYPDAKVDEEPQMGIVKLGAEGACWHCGELTCYAELNYQTWMCSEECMAAKDKEYTDAMISCVYIPDWKVSQSTDIEFDV